MLRYETMHSPFLLRWRTRLFTLLEAGAVAGCGVEPEPEQRYTCADPDPWPAINEGSDYEQCESGLVQRPNVGSCAAPNMDPPKYEPAPGYPLVAAEDFDVEGGCTKDADCTEMPFGHCQETVRSAPEPTTQTCSYSCATDDDCADDFACVCGALGGQCVPAACRSNEDCDGTPCMLVFQDQACGQPSGLELSCGTLGQECVSHEGCSVTELCLNGFCEPAQNTCGRPFLVRGEDRRAASQSSSDWLEHIASVDVESLTTEERQRLGMEFTQLGLMEHASVAAFARFVLQLLSLGAPASLVESAQKALADETRHAKLCFALATTYLQTPVGPGPLPVTHALEASDVASIFETAFFEACVGETCAALEAADRAESESDPVVANILRSIAEDEASHAALGWSFARWMVLHFNPQVTTACATLPEVVGRQIASSTPQRATALREVVLPCLQRLMALCNAQKATSPAVARSTAAPGDTSWMA